MRRPGGRRLDRYLAQALTCPVCGADGARAKARPAPWTFAECTDCGTFFVDPMPEMDTDDAHNTAAYYAGDLRTDEDEFEALALDAGSWRAARIETALGSVGRLLDVGCGTGFQLAAAATRGWEVEGVEVSNSAASYARSHHGVVVHTGTLASVGLPDDSFDAAILSHVVEHVPDPVGLLKDVSRILRPGGVALIAVPNASGLIYAAYNLLHRARGTYGRTTFSCSLFPPSHLTAYNPSSIKALVGRGGLNLESVAISGKGDPEHYPMKTWRGAGRAPVLQHAIEWVGRRTGKGSLLEAIARA